MIPLCRSYFQYHSNIYGKLCLKEEFIKWVSYLNKFKTLRLGLYFLGEKIKTKNSTKHNEIGRKLSPKTSLNHQWRL